MNIRFDSIQHRLGISLFALLILVGLLLAQISVWLFDQGLRRYLQNNLRDETELLVAALARGANGIELDQQRISASYHRPFSGYYFSIDLIPANSTSANSNLTNSTATNSTAANPASTPSSTVQPMDPEPITLRWRSRSLWDFMLPMPAKTGLQKQLADGPQEQQLLVYRAQYRRYGQQINIVVAQDYTPILDSFRRLQWIGGGVGVGALIFLILFQRYLVARALRPLEDARVQIAQLQQGQRTELDAQVPQELQPLVKQINHLLLHTEDTLMRSRNALGNLGHALKTPLAVLFSLANRQELNAHPELREQLRHQLANMQERIGRELGRARLTGEALPGAYFDCTREIPDLINTLMQIHGGGLHIAWIEQQSLRLPWDREDILELLGNVLDNACKWAKHQVLLKIQQDEHHFTLTVDDDGPGIPVDAREQVLQRGARIDELVQGHGLGLGIVRDIVEHCKGELELHTSYLGGLQVVIRLPIAAS